MSDELSEELLRELKTRTRFGAPYITRSELEALLREIERISAILPALERMAILIEQKPRSEELPKQLKTVSDENVRMLRETFGLPELTEEDSGEGILTEMRGMLEEYSDEELDSVELLRSTRGEEE
jgi:hypothetical protein